jgi:hypothetical protein
VAGDGSVVGLDDVDLDAALEVFLEVRRDPRIQLEQATHAAQALEGLGVDLTRPGMDDTPARMARAYAELFSPRPFWATHFPDDEGYDQMVLAKRIPFRSVCEHHMLAFTGVAYLGYLPGDRILGLSKLAGWWSTSPPRHRCRSDSPNRLGTGYTRTSIPVALVSSWRPSTPA